MTKEQAQETAKLIKAELDKLPDYSPRPAIKWHAHGEEIVGVELWMVNARAGNRTLHVIEIYAPEITGAHIRTVMGKANKADKAAFVRMAAMAAVDAE